MFRAITLTLGIIFLIATNLFAQAKPQSVQVCVARLDGAPVYHWRAFTSGFKLDDVDRALVLREFRRRNFNLPPRLVDEAIHSEVAKHYAGDEKHLAESLKHKGAQMADYRRFMAEEITISAMLYQSPHNNPRVEQASWLAGLHKGARIELIADTSKN